MLRHADQALLKESRGILFFFYALDRVSQNGDWLQVSDAIRALLRLILELKGFKQLHGKVFLRTYQYTRGNFTDLPDIAKIRAARVELLWSLTDLHGLLWQCLCNGTPDEARKHFRTRCQEASATCQHIAWELLKNDLLPSNQSPGRRSSNPKHRYKPSLGVANYCSQG